MNESDLEERSDKFVKRFCSFPRLLGFIVLFGVYKVLEGRSQGLAIR